MNNFLVLEQIKQWLSNQKQFPCLIAIAGPTCAGKSYFSRQLHDILTTESVIVCLDSYFRNIGEPFLPKTVDNIPIFDEPNSFHESEFVDAIQQLLLGNTVQLPIYDLANNYRTLSTSTLNSAPIIIAEGLFTINFLQYLKQPSLYIYVEADAQTCLTRRIKRDTKLIGISESTIRRHFEQQIIPRQHLYLEPQRHLANLIVNTS